jgi:predicted nuclease of predicted toxin-antitoxin system
MRFLADENFDNDILRGIRREVADFDVLRVQDTEIYTADDPTVLDWAAAAGRILLTHDIKTMPGYAYERVRAGLPMPGVIAIRRQVPLKQAIDELLVVIGASDEDEWQDQVTFLPLS